LTHSRDRDQSSWFERIIHVRYFLNYYVDGKYAECCAFESDASTPMDGDQIAVGLVLIVVSLVLYVVLRGTRLLVQGFLEGYREGQRSRRAATPQYRSPPTAHAAASASSTAAPNEGTVIAKEELIFLSYRRDDSLEVVGRIYDRLISDFSIQAVFKDVNAIPLGADFRDHLRSAVSEASIFLAIIGPRWIGKDAIHATTRLDDPLDYVRMECSIALERKIPVIPVLVYGAKMPAESDLPSDIASVAFRNAIPIRHDPDFHNDMNRLTKGIRDILACPKKQENVG